MVALIYGSVQYYVKGKDKFDSKGDIENKKTKNDEVLDK